MMIELTSEDLETIRTSLKYSKDRVSSAQNTPKMVRDENLERIDAVLKKLSQAQQSQ